MSGSGYCLKYRGTRFPVVLAETTIGRSPYCRIVLATPLASRHHAKLILKDGALQLVDLGSSNGTRLNGDPIQGPRTVVSGDIIAIGPDLLEVVQVAPKLGDVVPRLHDDEDDGAIADTARPRGDKTSLRSTPQIIESMMSNAREMGRPANVVTTVRRIIEQFVGDGDQKIERGDATRLIVIVETLRSWCLDGSIDDWCKEITARLESRLSPKSIRGDRDSG